MIFNFDSYIVNVNNYKTEKFMENLKEIEIELTESLTSMLSEMSINYKKPSYIKKLNNIIILKYHAVGELFSYDNVRKNSNLKFADGVHPIYNFDENTEIYFSEYVDMREEFLDENSFEINIAIKNN